MDPGLAVKAPVNEPQATGQAAVNRVPRSVLPAASPIFVSLCMVIIAGSLAMLLYLRAGLTLAEAGWIGLAALLVMVLAEFFSARARERAAVEFELQEMIRLSVGYERGLAGLGERVADIEATLTIRIDDMIDERVGTLQSDIHRLEAQVEELNGTLAAFQGGAGLAAPRAAARHAPVASRRDAAGRLLDDLGGLGDLGADDLAGGLAPDDFGAGGLEDDLQAGDGDLDDLGLDALGLDLEEEEDLFPGMTDLEAAAMIRRAVEERGPEIHLQSVVTLPQRRVQYYEALTRLRDDDGAGIMPDRFVPLAERVGIMPIVDNAVLFRSVQILRKMARKNRETGVFCNISTQSLSDSEFFQQFIEFMGENRNLSGSIIFEFTQAAFNDLGPIELANLEALCELGFRFSLDNVTRLDLDCSTLAERGVRYIKIDANTLMQSPQTAGANIHAADFAALLARYGIELIATRIETEAQVVDILDYDVKFGQGNLFSPPRPVRADMLKHAAPGEATS